MARTFLEYADRYAFYMAYGQICGYCHRPLDFNNFDIDHIIPVSAAADPQNWSNVLREYRLAAEFDVQADENRIAVCRPCNGEKRERLFPAGRLVILHSTAAQKAARIKQLRDKFVSERKAQRALAEVGKALSAAILLREDVLDLLGKNPDDLSRPIETPWPSDGDAAVFRNLLGAASANLLNWPQEIDGQWLPRPELDDIRTALGGDKIRLIALLGPPGCGKSALLARLGTELRTAGQTLLAIKADALPTSVDSLASIDGWLNAAEPLPILLDRMAAKAPVTLLIDQTRRPFGRHGFAQRASRGPPFIDKPRSGDTGNPRCCIFPRV